MHFAFQLADALCTQRCTSMRIATVNLYMTCTWTGQQTNTCVGPCLKLSHSKAIFEAAATMLHRPCSCHLQDGKLHFQQHGTLLLQVWVRDVLEAQQVLDYRTGQRFKKSEVHTLWDIHQHHAASDHPLQSSQPGLIRKCMLAAEEPACLGQLQWLNIYCIAYRQTCCIAYRQSFCIAYRQTCYIAYRQTCCIHAEHRQQHEVSM
jgi:hypothetical protein